MTSQRPSSQAGRFIPKRVPFDPSPQIDHRLGKEGKAIVLSPAGQHLVALTQSLLDQPVRNFGAALDGCRGGMVLTLWPHQRLFFVAAYLVLFVPGARIWQRGVHGG